MPIQIIRNDITKMQVDAIVNSANRYLRDGSGVNGAIHKAAGPELLKECSLLGGCRTGEAKITKAYHLPSKYVIHTVGPVWHGGNDGEKEKLESCYRSSLELARKYECKSIAFPLISSGVFGYPNEQALTVAMNTISSFLLMNDDVDDLMIYLVVFGKESVQVSSKLFYHIERFIDDNYVDEHMDRRRSRSYCEEELAAPQMCDVQVARECPSESKQLSSLKMKSIAIGKPISQKSLDELLIILDESFSEMLVRKIKEKGMKNSECYKKANLDKKLFSKIYKDPHYKPKKQTAVALAIALELSLDETKEFLMKAGFALSRSDKFDVIIEYFIRNKKYNIFEINEVLFYYDQMLLGSTMN